jgi:hypothetical protein
LGVEKRKIKFAHGSSFLSIQLISHPVFIDQ